MKINLWHGSYEADMKVAAYGNGRTAIQLYDQEDGCPLLTATVNLPEVTDEVIQKLCDDRGMNASQFLLIKDCSKNEGVYQSLVEADVIEPVMAWVPTGHVQARVAFLKKEV